MLGAKNTIIAQKSIRYIYRCNWSTAFHQLMLDNWFFIHVWKYLFCCLICYTAVEEHISIFHGRLGLRWVLGESRSIQAENASNEHIFWLKWRLKNFTKLSTPIHGSIHNKYSIVCCARIRWPAIQLQTLITNRI